MAFNTTTLGLYHTFSKTPVDQNQGSAAAQLGNAINKSGHTVQSSEVWAEAIPFYGKAGKTELAHKNLSATANTNDLVQVGSVLYQRNSTPAQFDASGVLTSTFEDLWFEKTTSIISTVKGEDGQYPTAEGALVDGSYLVNAEGKPVIRYYKDRLLTPLIDDNNANTHSQGWASRLKVDGRWVEQFVGATDAYVNGNAAVMYSPVIYRKKGDAKPLDAGAGKHYMDYCATGIILWDSQKTSITTNSAGEFTGATEVISCFEYVGKKLNASLASLATDIEAINIQLGNTGTGTTGGGIGERLSDVEEALEVLNGAATEPGSIANLIKTAIDEIPEVQNATTDVAGVVTISGNTAIATTDTSTAAATVAAVAATRSAIAGEMGALAGTIEDAMEEAKAKVASVSGPTTGLVTVTGDKEVTITVSDQIATKTNVSDAISDATSKTAIVDNDTSTKLVTAAQVATYVASEVGAIDTGVTSISVNGGEAQKGAVSITALDGVDTSELRGVSSTSIYLSNAGNKVKLTAISSGAQVSGNTLSYASDTDYLATAADADVIATFRANAAKTALADTAITGSQLSVTGSGVSVTLGGKVGAPTLTGSVTPATYTSATKTWTNDTNFATASDIATAISDAVGAITIPSVTTSTAAQTVGVTASGHEVSVATAAYTPSTETGEIGTWTDATKGYLVTGATVAAAIGDVNAKVDALHQTPQFKVVVVDGVTDLTKWQDSVTGGIQENYIYLVENIEAADGSYIEYIAYKNGETLVTERIGTTKTDLSGYAKSVTINGQTYTATAANAGALDLGTVVTHIEAYTAAAPEENLGTVHAHIDGGGLYLGIASASSSVMGVSKMFTGDLTTDASTVTDTAVSVKSAQAMYSSLANLANSKVSSVIEDAYLNLAGLAAVTDSYNYVRIKSQNIDSIEPMTYVINSTNIIGVKDCTLVESDNNGYRIDTSVFAFGENVDCNSFFDNNTKSNIEYWIGDMPNLVGGYEMFYLCSALTSFCGDLSSLTNGYGMFASCSNLTSFCGDLSSLTNGD